MSGTQDRREEGRDEMSRLAMTTSFPSRLMPTLKYRETNADRKHMQDR